MHTPEDNSEGYRKSAPINFAEGLKGKLLIVHGTGETNTHIEITEGLVDRLIELGKQFDYMAYPSRDHGISRGSGTSIPSTGSFSTRPAITGCLRQRQKRNHCYGVINDMENKRHNNGTGL